MGPGRGLRDRIMEVRDQQTPYRDRKSFYISVGRKMLSSIGPWKREDAQSCTQGMRGGHSYRQPRLLGGNPGSKGFCVGSRGEPWHRPTAPMRRERRERKCLLGRLRMFWGRGSYTEKEKVQYCPLAWEGGEGRGKFDHPATRQKTQAPDRGSTHPDARKESRCPFLILCSGRKRGNIRFNRGEVTITSGLREKMALSRRKKRGKRATLYSVAGGRGPSFGEVGRRGETSWSKVREPLKLK